MSSVLKINTRFVDPKIRQELLSAGVYPKNGQRRRGGRTYFQNLYCLGLVYRGQGGREYDIQIPKKFLLRMRRNTPIMPSYPNVPNTVGELLDIIDSEQYPVHFIGYNILG